MEREAPEGYNGVRFHASAVRAAAPAWRVIAEMSLCATVTLTNASFDSSWLTSAPSCMASRHRSVTVSVSIWWLFDGRADVTPYLPPHRGADSKESVATLPVINSLWYPLFVWSGCAAAASVAIDKSVGRSFVWLVHVSVFHTRVREWVHELPIKQPHTETSAFGSLLRIRPPSINSPCASCLFNTSFIIWRTYLFNACTMTTPLSAVFCVFVEPRCDVSSWPRTALDKLISGCDLSN